MNWPNRLTTLRVLLVPVIIIVMFIEEFYINIEIFEQNINFNFFALILFVVASFTDFLDGYLARRNNQVTTFGKFMDPLADKLLTTSVMLVFMEQGLIESWVLIIIISREFIVSGLRLVASNEGIVISAGMSGKYKTVVTMLAIIMFLSGIEYANYVIYLATILTIYSGSEYLIRNRDVILKSI